MNAMRHLTPALMFAAVLAAAFTVQSAQAGTPVVTLPRVEIVAKRPAVVPAPMPVARLPLVTVIGKRPVAEPTRLAQKSAAAPTRSL